MELCRTKVQLSAEELFSKRLGVNVTLEGCIKDLYQEIMEDNSMNNPTMRRKGIFTISLEWSPHPEWDLRGED